MTYYSGTSKFEYETQTALDKRNPTTTLRIHCYDSEIFGDFSARNLAQALARKRARQVDSEPLVIEITEPGDFEVKWDAYPILEGKLNPQNHKIHTNIEDFLSQASE